MAIKHDKNLDPFGHCEDCGGQLRVGGKPGRVRAFVSRYPWAAAGALPVTVTVPVTVTGSEPAPEPVTEPVAVTEKPKRKQASWADGLALLGGARG